MQRDKSQAQTGKGSYWTINPKFQAIVDRDLLRKRPATWSAGSADQPAKKICSRRSTVNDARRAAGSSVSSAAVERDQSDHADEFLNDLNDDDVFDISWSTMLGSDFGCPSDVDDDRAPSRSVDAESRRQRPVDVASSATEDGGSGRPTAAVDNDAELDELIRACADTDPAGMLDDFGDFAGLDVDVHGGGGVDSLDLTIHGVGLRPPDWWLSFCDNLDVARSTTAAAPRLALDTAAAQDGLGTQHQQQQQRPHPWAESRHPAMISAPLADSSPFDALGLLAGGQPTSFDSDGVDDF